MKRPGRIHVGTSGWHYAHWKGPFYPEGLRPADFLSFYAERFGTVEINNSFYRLPEEKTFRDWARTVPENFVFSVKASRLVTHNKKLQDPERTLPLFIERVRSLGKKLGPLLFQLPPGWNLNLERLRDFLSALPDGFRFAFEFRNRTWLTDAVYEALADRGAAFCIYDLDRFLSPMVVTTGFVYIRLHGPDGPYRGSYSEAALSGWAGDMKGWQKEGLDVYCYFDNDEAGYAALNAMKLREMTGG